MLNALKFKVKEFSYPEFLEEINVYLQVSHVCVCVCVCACPCIRT